MSVTRTPQSSSIKPNEYWVTPFAAAAVGGISETVALFWTDTIAKRLQQNRGKVFGWNVGRNKEFQVMLNVVENAASLNKVIFRDLADSPNAFRKFASLYSGVGAGMSYKVLQRTYKIGTQKKLQGYLEKDYHFSKNAAAGISGSIVGAGEVIMAPLDLLKVVKQTRKPTDPSITLKEIFTFKHGNPWKSSTLIIPRNVIGSGALFSSREFLQKFLQEYDIYGHKVGPYLANAAATALSIILPSPFDVIKTRIQAANGKVNVWGAIKDTYNAEGFSAFFKGAFTKVLTQGPKVVFCLSVVDKIEPQIPSVIDAMVKWSEKKSEFPTGIGRSSLSLFGGEKKASATVDEAHKPTNMPSKKV